jgi:heat shock protein HslJ
MIAVCALAVALTACAQPGSGGGNDGPDRDGPGRDGSGGKTTQPTPTLTEEFVVGSWGDPDEAGEPYLEFSDDGSVAGSDGCNQLVGTWTLESEQIVFSDLATTLMACEGVNTWLSAASTAVLEQDDDDELRILNSEGVPIGTLDRDGPDFAPDLDD